MFTDEGAVMVIGMKSSMDFKGVESTPLIQSLPFGLSVYPDFPLSPPKKEALLLFLNFEKKNVISNLIQ